MNPRSPFHGIQFKTMLSYLLLAAAIIIAYKFIMGIDVFINSIRWFFGVISPFMTGFLLAYILNIPCGGIQRLLSRSKRKFVQKRKKAISILSVYLLALVIVFLILRVIIPSLGQSISLFAANFAGYKKSAQEFIEYLNSLDILTMEVSIDSLLNTVRDFTLQRLPSSLDALTSVSAGVFNIILSLISSVYILAEKDNFKRYLDRLVRVFLPRTAYSVTLKYAVALNANCKQYIYTQTLDGMILGTIATIELFILKSPYSLVLGIMLGVVNYIPYFGSIFGSVLTVLVVAFTQGITPGVAAAVILIVTQQIDANVIQPRLMSGSFSLSPLLVIISVTIGGAIANVIGMLIAIPIIAVVKDMSDELTAYYEKRKAAEYTASK